MKKSKSVRTVKKDRKKEKPAKPAKKTRNREYEPIRQKLVSDKEMILKRVQSRSAEVKSLSETEVRDNVDLASDDYEKEVLYGLTDKELKGIKAIESALARIEGNTFGICEGCKKKINRERLLVVPSARFCIVCQNREEERARKERELVGQRESVGSFEGYHEEEE